MVEIDIPIPPSKIRTSDSDIPRAVETAIIKLGFSTTMDGTLKSFPGSRHWHLKLLKRSGTLEVTWWPVKQRLWISYHENRVGDGWVATAASELANAVASAL